MGTLLGIGLSNALAAAVLAPLVAVVARVLRRRPALAHGLWMLVILKLVTPPLFTVEIPLPEPANATGGAEGGTAVGPADRGEAPAPEFEVLDGGEIPSPVDVGSAPPGPDLGAEFESSKPDVAAAPSPVPAPAAEGPAVAETWSWREAIGVAWLASSAAWLGLAAARIARFRRAIGAAGPAPDDVRWRVEELAMQIGLRRAPEVVLVPGPVSPLVWALAGRARLVVPSGLWGRLDDDQRDATILHELAHLRRRDHWVRLVELAVTGLYWWHPALWWARRGLHEAEEQCCDAWVVWARPGSARTYAAALVEAVEFLSATRPAPLPLGASGMGRIRHISRRIAMIMKGKTPRTLSWLGLLTLLALAGLLLPWLPTWGRPAQKPAPAAVGDLDEVRSLADQIELLANGVELKEALLRKAEAQREVPKADLARMKRLQKMNGPFISQEEVAKTEAQLEVADADVAVAKAELREAMLKLRQAQRRLAGLTAAPTERPGPGGPVRPPLAPSAPAPPPAPQAEIQASNNLKQIMLALHNYAAQHGHFPPPAITSPDGQPLLSWRVAILPYIEQQPLYNELHLDEPWDSEHNKPLLERMPEVFAGSSPTDAPSDHTGYLAVVGPQTIWGTPEGVKPSEVVDGTSNTLMVVASPGQGVPWAAPADLSLSIEAGTPFDEAIQKLNAEESLTVFRAGFQFLGAFADGSVRRLGPLAPPVLLALLTRAGGEVVSADALGPSGQPGATPPPTATTTTTTIEIPSSMSRGPGPAAMDPRTVNNLKQIGLALHNYHDVNGRFPPPAIADKDGQPLLSWRVAILPYLDQQALYEKFHLDEPWDSEHNRALIDEMPAVFRPSGLAPGRPLRASETTIVAPVGPGTIWDNPQGNPIPAIIDGTSYTILAFSSPAPLDWTSPGDMPYPNTAGYRMLYRDGFPALLADGSVRRIWPDDPAVFHALFSRAGSEVIDSSRIDSSQAKQRPPYSVPPHVGASEGMMGMMMGGMMGRPGGMDETMKGGYEGMMGMPGMSGRGMMSGMAMPGMGGRGMGGSDTDPARRIADLEAQINSLKREIDQLRQLAVPAGKGLDVTPAEKPDR